MQFVLIGRDGQDPDALDRRMAVREKHLAMCQTLKAQGRYITGGAMLNDDGQMIGSVVIYDFPDRQALEAWLPTEPYIQGNVWQDIEINPFRIPGSPA
jgi:uncharacterized protein YciI